MPGSKPAEAIFRPALILMSGRFIGFVVAFAVPMVLARLFSQEDFGTYKQLFLIFGTLFAIAQFGMAESLYYFLPNDQHNAARYVRNTLLVLGGVGLLCLGVMALLREPIARLLNNPLVADYVPLVGVYLLFMLLSVVMEIVLTVRKQHFRASCVYALTDVARAVFYLVPVLLFGGLHGLMLGAIGFALARLIAMLLMIHRELGGARATASEPVEGGLLRRHLGYALPFGLAALIETVQVNYHMYAVSWHFDAATFAIYAVGCLQIPVIDLLMTSTSNVMMVSMRERAREGDMAGARALWLDASRKLALVLCPFIGVLLVCAHELIVLLYTETYADSVPIFMIWTLASALTLLLTDGVLRVFAETHFLIVQNLVRLALVAVSINWLMQRFGLTGAVMATVFATLCARLLALFRIKRVMGVHLRELLPWGHLALIILMAAFAAVPALVLKQVLALPLLLQLGVTGLVYCLGYVLLLLWIGPMDTEERRMLLRWARLPALRLHRRTSDAKIGSGEVPKV